MIDRKQQDFRICMLYEFRLGHSAKGAFMRLSRVYGEKLSYRTICGYFNRFRQGDYSLKHQGCHGPRRIDDNLLAAFLKQNPTVKCDELAGIFDVKLSTLYSHLRNLRQGTRSNFITWKHEMARKTKMETERKRSGTDVRRPGFTLASRQHLSYPIPVHAIKEEKPSVVESAGQVLWKSGGMMLATDFLPPSDDSTSCRDHSTDREEIDQEAFKEELL